MARRFWITVAPAVGRPAGTYTGTVTVNAEQGGKRRVPLQVTILAAELPEPEFLFTLYGIGLHPK